MRLTGIVAATLVVAGTAFTAPKDAGEQREVARIRVHFDSVLAALPTRDVSPLSPVQRARRTALLHTLAGYREQGVFPHNYDFPGQAVPYFVDRRTGTLCAVAYLLESTGRRDIVDRVAASNNNVRVHELAGDTAFVGWLTRNGLTLDEAAFIQVPYQQPVSAAEVARNATFMVVAPVALGGAAVTTLYNAWANRDGHSSFGRRAGMSFGLLTAGAGASVLMKTDAPAPVGLGVIAVGVTSAVLAGRSMRNHGEIVAREQAERARVASIAPVVSATSAGVQVSMRF